MRGLKQGQPWLLLEQTPSQTQWRPYNPLKRPGVMRLQSYQAIGHGSEGALFFQWRQSRGSEEMHHGAIVGHAGHSTRVFQEVAGLGAELQSLGTRLLGTRVNARVALMFSWPNWWAVEYRPRLSASVDYLDEVSRYYAALWSHNIAVDIIEPNQSLAGYDLVIAPLLYMLSDSEATAIEQFVEAGGTFVTTYLSGIVDHNSRAWLGGYPGPLRRTLGVWIEEMDPLLPGQTNVVVAPEGTLLASDAYQCDQWCDIVQLEGASSIATFGEDFYTGQPAITEHQFGAGRSYYVATRPETRLLEHLLGSIVSACGVRAPLIAPQGIEVIERSGATGRFSFLLNHHPEEQTISLLETMRDLLSGVIHHGAITLPKYGVAILVSLHS